MARWTRRRNGQRMLTVRVAHHLDRTDVVNALAYRYKYDDPAGLPDLSAAAALREIRETLGMYGSELPGFWTDYAGLGVDEIEEWANGIADRLGAPPQERNRDTAEES